MYVGVITLYIYDMKIFVEYAFAFENDTYQVSEVKKQINSKMISIGVTIYFLPI